MFITLIRIVSGDIYIRICINDDYLQKIYDEQKHKTTTITFLPSLI